MKVKVPSGAEVGIRKEALPAGLSACGGSELEQISWDPKDGDLCLCRAKPGETLVEARSDTDVQIVRLTWV